MAVASFHAFLPEESYYLYRHRANLWNRNKQPGNSASQQRRGIRLQASANLPETRSLKEWPDGISTISPATAILRPTRKEHYLSCRNEGIGK
jgi:hypothetical protein